MNMLRFFLLAALCCFSYICRAQSDTLFFNQATDSIVMVEFKPVHQVPHVIDKQGNFAVPVLKRAVITENETEWLTKALNSKKSFGGGEAGCFDPHLGIVFYHDGKITGHLTICVGCNRLYGSQKIPAQQQDKYVTDEGDVYYLGQGMSDKFLSGLDKLLAHYEFQYRVKK
jgi:hypothetical protein